MFTITLAIKRRVAEIEAQAENLEQKKDELVRELHSSWTSNTSNLTEVITEEIALINNMRIEINDLINRIERRTHNYHSEDRQITLLSHLLSFLKDLKERIRILKGILLRQSTLLKHGKNGDFLKTISEENSAKSSIRNTVYGEEYYLRRNNIDFTSTIHENRIDNIRNRYIAPVAQAAAIILVLLSTSLGSFAQPNFHITRKGDTWYNLGARYGLDYRWLAKANGMDSEEILPRRVKLRLPGKVKEQKQKEAIKKVKVKYVVKGGDNPYSIAKRFGMNVDQLKQLNNKRTLKVIFPGDELLVLVPAEEKEAVEKEEEKQEVKIQEEIKYDFMEHYKNRAPEQPDKKEWNGITFRTAPQGVTKYNNHPAILIEFCFLNNSNEYHEFGRYKNIILDRVMRSLAEFMAKTNLKILILDAGHGGEDGGAPNPKLGINEKDETLLIAKNLETAAKSIGINVLMTRSDDSYLSTNDRWKKYANVPGAIFVSIHLNSAINPNASGYEVFCYDPAKDPIDIKKHPKKKGNRNPSRLILSESLAAYVTHSIDMAVINLPNIGSNILAQNR